MGSEMCIRDSSRIAQFMINDDGSLTRQADVEIVDTELLRARMFAGIAGF